MCRNKLAVLAFALLAAVPAFAQRTVVTGTVTDTAGLPYSQASLTVTLSLPTGAIGAYLGGAQIAGTAGPFKLDNNGSFLVQLPDNTLIQCANAAGQLVACAPQTTWLFTFTSPGILPPVGTGPQTFSSTQTISGVSQTLTISTGPRQVATTGVVSFPLLAPPPFNSCAAGQIPYSFSGSTQFNDAGMTTNATGTQVVICENGAQILQVGNPTIVNFTFQTNSNWTAGGANDGTSGVLTCSAGTVTKAIGYTSTPTIVVSDETTSGGARVSAKSATSFTVTCTGATDVVDYFIRGNPN